jgi:hypothetical protein
LNQTTQFCGVGSHHQNDIVERRIRDLSDSARASLLHAIHHWPNGVSKNLWPFAIKYACNIRNRVRSFDGKTPEEKFSGAPSTFTTDVSQYHPFGCPAYVLDARLQGGNKIPRWEPRSWVGVYLVHSPYHANSIALILNLTTGHVFLQYHVVYDDNFTTVDSLKLGTVPTNWPDLYSTRRDLVPEESFMLAPEWTADHSIQGTIHWLDAHLDSVPTTADTLFPLEPSTSMDAVPGIGEIQGARIVTSANPFSGTVLAGNESASANEGVAQSKGDPRSEGVTGNEGVALRRGRRNRQQTSRQIEDPHFGCAALQCSRFQRFELHSKALCTLSFIALQQKYSSFAQQLDDGSENLQQHFAFPATTSVNDTYFHNQALSQPDRGSFIKAMV